MVWFFRMLGHEHDRTLRLARLLLHSRLAHSLVDAMLLRQAYSRPHGRVVARFFLETGRRALTDRRARVVHANLLFPVELLWGLGLVPFHPEIASATGGSLGAAGLGLDRAQELGYAVDLCTVHRNALGMYALGLYPRADAFVAASCLCDVSGQVLANLAEQQSRPFHLLDVPSADSEASLRYVADQLQAITEQLCRELGVHLDEERLHQAITLSNQARELALDTYELRARKPSPLRGSDMLSQLAYIAAMFGSPYAVDYYFVLRAYIKCLLGLGVVEQAKQRLRLYWMHVRPYYPSELCSLLEDEHDAVIAFEEMSEVWWQPLDVDQPFRSLAAKVLSSPFNGPVQRRIDNALRHIAKFQAEGVVHFNHWGCRHSQGALRVLRDELRRHGLPLLQLDGDCIDPSNLQMGPLRTRVEAFVEMLGTG